MPNVERLFLGANMINTIAMSTMATITTTLTAMMIVVRKVWEAEESICDEERGL
jgi:hypothetical protein